MEYDENPDKFIKNANKLRKNSNKLFPRFLVFLKKIRSVSEFDDYFKNKIEIPIIDWFIEYFIIKSFLIFICLSAFGINFIRFPSFPNSLFLAEGISIFWFLLTELKKELWRK